MKDKLDVSSEDKILDSLEEVEEELGITYDQVQKDAIIKALQSKVFILTGGPGTGKTTVINGIIKTYADLHGLDLKKSDLPIILAAPTGRAARRMNELTKLPSATIHRHLGLNGLFLNLVIGDTKLIFHPFKTCLDFVLSTDVRLVFRDTS